MTNHDHILVMSDRELRLINGAPTVRETNAARRIVRVDRLTGEAKIIKDSNGRLA